MPRSTSERLRGEASGQTTAAPTPPASGPEPGLGSRHALPFGPQQFSHVFPGALPQIPPMYPGGTPTTTAAAGPWMMFPLIPPVAPAPFGPAFPPVTPVDAAFPPPMPMPMPMQAPMPMQMPMPTYHPPLMPFHQPQSLLPTPPVFPPSNLAGAGGLSMAPAMQYGPMSIEAARLAINEIRDRGEEARKLREQAKAEAEARARGADAGGEQREADRNGRPSSTGGSDAGSETAAPTPGARRYRGGGMGYDSDSDSDVDPRHGSSPTRGSSGASSGVSRPSRQSSQPHDSGDQSHHHREVDITGHGAGDARITVVSDGPGGHTTRTTFLVDRTAVTSSAPTLGRLLSASTPHVIRAERGSAATAALRDVLLLCHARQPTQLSRPETLQAPQTIAYFCHYASRFDLAPALRGALYPFWRERLELGAGGWCKGVADSRNAADWLWVLLVSAAVGIPGLYSAVCRAVVMHCPTDLDGYFVDPNDGKRMRLPDQMNRLLKDHVYAVRECRDELFDAIVARLTKTRKKLLDATPMCRQRGGDGGRGPATTTTTTATALPWAEGRAWSRANETRGRNGCEDAALAGLDRWLDSAGLLAPPPHPPPGSSMGELVGRIEGLDDDRRGPHGGRCGILASLRDELLRIVDGMAVPVLE